MHYRSSAVCLLVILFITILFSSSVLANNLNITNVRMGTRDPSAKTLSVVFDLTWDNSWRNKINHDAAWLTVRLSDSQSSSGVKELCPIMMEGISPVGTSAGTKSNAEIYVPKDKTGAFIRPSAHQSTASFSTKDVKITVDYSQLSLSDDARITAHVFGIEMVFVPEGFYSAGDFITSTASFRQGSADNDPWEIQSDDPISVASVNNGGYYYTSSGVNGEYATGASFVIPQEFPKGYKSFYAMKYELTEGLWVEFVNSLPSSARFSRDLTDNAHKRSDAVIARNTMACSGNPLICTTSRSVRPVSYLTWQDLCAVLDWAGLRPMSELEFEKAARGPVVPVKGEFVWGTAATVSLSSLSGDVEDGNEVSLTVDANANFGGQTIIGGDSNNGEEYQKGPVRTGLFSTEISTRNSSGATYYGIMELSGNLKEWIVTVGNLNGLAFTGKNGNGYLTTLSGFEGNADVEGWPGMDSSLDKGITSAAGAGFRGGSWMDSADRLRTSDRSEAAIGAEDSQPTYGGRGVRTVDDSNS